MKTLFIILSILMLNKECDQKTSSTVNPEEAVSETYTAMIQSNIKISYEASTRGFYEKTWVTKDSMTVTTDRNHEKTAKYAVEESDWDELMKLLSVIDIEVLPEIEAPTSKRHYDGAAFATLTISEGKEETISNNFDHGFPPKTIEELVNKVLSMKQMHEKN